MLCIFQMETAFLLVLENLYNLISEKFSNTTRLDLISSNKCFRRQCIILGKWEEALCSWNPDLAECSDSLSALCGKTISEPAGRNPRSFSPRREKNAGNLHIYIQYSLVLISLSPHFLISLHFFFFSYSFLR